MRRKLPPLNALLAFEAAARHVNFTRAAQELAVAQPAVTRHIAKLEAWVGAPLFRRRGSAVELTEEGRRVADLATAAFDRLELGLRDAVQPSGTELVIAASFGVAHLWLMPRIGGMREAAHAAITFVTSDDYRGFDDLSVDCSVRFGTGTFGTNGADLLFAERCFVIAAPAFLKAHPEFDPRDPAARLDPRLMLDHGDAHGAGWMTWARWCTHHGSELPRSGGLSTVRSYPTMLDMVCAGEGVAIGSAGLDDHLVASGALVRLGGPVARPGHGYYLVYRRDARAKPPLARLREFLLASGAAVA